jgi:hypothetical protein
MSIYFWTEQEFMEEQFAAMIGTKFHWIFGKQQIDTHYL